jgi:hypothetical protein
MSLVEQASKPPVVRRPDPLFKPSCVAGMPPIGIVASGRVNAVAEDAVVVQFGVGGPHWPGGGLRDLTWPRAVHPRLALACFSDGRVAELLAIRDDLVSCSSWRLAPLVAAAGPWDNWSVQFRRIGWSRGP